MESKLITGRDVQMYGSRLRLTGKPNESSVFHHDSLYKNRSHRLVAVKLIENYEKTLKENINHTAILLEQELESIDQAEFSQLQSIIPILPASYKLNNDRIDTCHDINEEDDLSMMNGTTVSTAGDVEKDMVLMEAGLDITLKKVISANEWRKMGKRHSECVAKIAHNETRLMHWKRKAQELKKFECVESLVFLQNLVDSEKESLTIDSERCKKCGGLFLMDPITNVNVCIKCCLVVERLFIQEDSATDVLILRSGVSGTNNNARKRKKGICTTYLADENSKLLLDRATGKKSRFLTVSEMTTSHEYQKKECDTVLAKISDVRKRVSSYSRFIEQFGEHQPDIPDEVMSVIYNDLSTVHLMSSVRCRPTPIATILRNHGYLKWVPFANVISRQFNGQECPRLSASLLQKLRARFELISSITTEQQRKSLSVDLVTSICLRAEGYPELAQMFSLIKTRHVASVNSERVRAIIEQAKKLNSSIDWDLVFRLQ